jgi:hypothetical protein
MKSIFNLQMSDSSESDSSNRPDCDLDGEVSVASSYGSEVQACRKRPRQPQIQGNSWVLRSQIIIDQLHTNSDWMVAGPEGEIENEDRITKLHSRLQGLFGAQFEILFGKLFGNVMFFVNFCNLSNISDVGTDSNDAVKIETEIRGFLQLCKPLAVTEGRTWPDLRIRQQNGGPRRHDNCGRGVVTVRGAEAWQHVKISHRILMQAPKKGMN